MKGEAMRVTLLGLGCNLFLGGLQLISGSYFPHLQDSFADLITLGVVQLTLHILSQLPQDGRVNQIAVGACLLTIASKEGLYRITRRAAERLNSSVLLANAWHHRSDAMSSGMVLIGVLCRVFVHSAFDPMAGAVMSSIILRISWGIGRRAIAELLDMQLPPTERREDRVWPLKGHAFL
eukprot:g16320.t1